jgi:hypothetical protein
MNQVFVALSILDYYPILWRTRPYQPPHHQSELGCQQNVNSTDMRMIYDITHAPANDEQ